LEDKIRSKIRQQPSSKAIVMERRKRFLEASTDHNVLPLACQKPQANFDTCYTTQGTGIAVNDMWMASESSRTSKGSDTDHRLLAIEQRMAGRIPPRSS
jgi:hypothetical protein